RGAGAPSVAPDRWAASMNLDDDRARADVYVHEPPFFAAGVGLALAWGLLEQGFAFGVAVLAVCVAGWSALAERFGRPRVGRVRADRHGLHVDGKAVASAASVRRHVVYTGRRGLTLRLVRPFAPVDVVVRSMSDARDLVASLGLSGAGRPA